MGTDLTNAEETLKVLEADEGLKRVWIVQRSDAVYVLRPEEWYQDVFEGEIVSEGWKPIYDNFGLFGSADLAASEAMTSFEWLAHSPRKKA
ncbi:hypothetical protein [Rhizobium leguminosarum]|uniref:hypothetical protein n=1 Tax=Rhizobium leguminosarum TaxID=384 RepID=UPI00037DA7E6|nr:hypothetical protein [Rhizobium leguminosarum]